MALQLVDRGVRATIKSMDYEKLPAFDEDGAIHVVVECPRGTSVKLKFDTGLGAFSLSRPLPEGLVYPYDWGFVPSTRASDGDPLDAIVVWDRQSFPGVVLPCRLLGVLEVEQNNKERPEHRERNDRLIAVPVESPNHHELASVDDLPRRMKEEIEEFFRASTAFENKDLKFGGWRDPVTAYEIVRISLRKV
jgi:inorganic pyrophosphatase